MKKEIFATIRLFLTIAFLMDPSLTYSQYYLNVPSKQTGIGYARFYDGYWGEQKILKKQNFCMFGNYDSFIIYNSNTHPSNYAFKVTIDNFHKPSKSETNNGKGWVEYRGKVEYYVNEEHPTIKDVFKDKNSLFFGPLDCTHPVKRIADATISIKAFNNHPKVYNIWFDDVGFAIFLYNAKFKK